MSSDPVLPQILIQVVLILVNAVFACAEISIISLNELLLRKKAETGDKKAERLIKLLENPTKFLATIQVGITLAGFLGSAFAADNFAQRLTNLLIELRFPLPATTINTISVIVITLILSYFTLILGELVPKRVAMKQSEKIAMALANFIYLLMKLTGPIVSFLNMSTNAVLILFGIDPKDEGEEVTEEGIRALVDAGSLKGAIAPEERKMIENIFEFNNKDVSEIMVHRTDVDFLWMEDSLDKWEQTFIETNHGVLPVCGDDIDDIIGTLSVKHFYAAIRDDIFTVEEMRKYILPPRFIPEYVTINILFQNMQRAKSHFFFVLDEYGGLSGIITINDLLEEIVGDFDDETTADIHQISELKWRIKGTTPLCDVWETIGFEIPDENFDTLGGLIVSRLQRIPLDANVPPIDADGLTIQVEEVGSRRIEWATVEITDPELIKRHMAEIERDDHPETEY